MMYMLGGADISMLKFHVLSKLCVGTTLVSLHDKLWTFYHTQICMENFEVIHHVLGIHFSFIITT